MPTSALSRAEVTGDFGSSLISSKVRSTRRRDCGDYQAAARTTCSAAEAEIQARDAGVVADDRFGSKTVQSAPVIRLLQYPPGADISRVCRHVANVPNPEEPRMSKSRPSQRTNVRVSAPSDAKCQGDIGLPVRSHRQSGRVTSICADFRAKQSARSVNAKP